MDNKADFKPVTQRHDKVLLGSPDSPIDCFEKMTPEEAFTYFD